LANASTATDFESGVFGGDAGNALARAVGAGWLFWLERCMNH
jgi:hypothetical protein